MEKKVRRFEVLFNFDWTYGVTIEKLRRDLDELEKLGVTEIEIKADNSYGCASIEIEAFTNRLETDEEFQERVDREDQHKEDIKRRELAELEKLKLKYGV